jgi:signal peptidase I
MPPVLWVSALGMVIVLIFLAPLGMKTFWGIGFAPVLSNSMSPNIAIGDLEITRPVLAHSVEVGDVVLLADGESGIQFSHRVMQIQSPNITELNFETKGDNNPLVDQRTVTIPRADELPMVMFTIPRLGGLLTFLSSSQSLFMGCFLLVTAGVLYLVRLRATRASAD